MVENKYDRCDNNSLYFHDCMKNKYYVNYEQRIPSEKYPIMDHISECTETNLVCTSVLFNQLTV